ncbi:YdiK family protein [Cytobacillus pseudoceanisediminis]|uniref:YdiK family protein n=1 Tax=Cytobacillus pseudoceanisediminis TaxID=3051614 RepID=A0ABZ2ZJJ1_9BACI|nr:MULTISPECIES: YdiK family protein [Bacillaceae]MBU8773160.1 YdiK family protein [Cytobacillus oceanisediminis]MCS0674767.1 YdiK family protein [Cytobacillus firmus]MCS0791214.1 YdiK family protein [Cytobacillus firmus]UOE55758.1 YdiK family protein [Cytobacillus oceanisediminis]USK50214.1 YdiK family protein [Bacillus sp. CMF12]
MRSTPLFSGFIYILLGCLFTFIAIQNIQREETWGFFTYFLIIIATFDFGTGLRMVGLHFKMKNKMKK